MRDDEWRRWDDHRLEQLLIERWLYRGMMLAVILVAGIVTTYLGSRGLSGVADRITVGVLMALALAAAGVAFGMRVRDVRIHRELRRRRLPPRRFPDC